MYCYKNTYYPKKSNKLRKIVRVDEKYLVLRCIYMYLSMKLNGPHANKKYFDAYEKN